MFSDEMLFEHAKNLFGLTKLFLLKCSVGLIVLEGLIANFLVNSGKSPYSSDDGDDMYDMEEKTQRGYCKHFATSFLTYDYYELFCLSLQDYF